MHGLSPEVEDEALTLLQEVGFRDPSSVLEQLRQLAHSTNIRKMSQRGRERLDVTIPLLLAMVLEQSHPDEALQRTLNLMESIAQRSVYLALLIERPQVLEQLVRLCAGSAWIAEQITRYPLLLDELLDPRRLYDPLKPEELDQALQTQLTYLPTNDLEVQMDSMRHFKRAYILHVAAAEISGHLKVEIASDYLSAIADTLVRRTLVIAWNHLSEQHGQPYCQEGKQRRLAGFCVIAYGKAGSIELNYGSDLDIIFLHDSQGIEQMTDGNRPLDNSVFFSRVARRMIHLLSTNTPAGILYEVDPRLRPSGNSGLLVSSFDAFITYQYHSAWTWEHQALVRARAIAGDSECMKRFEQIRREILRLPRDPVTLRQEVIEMRQKMRESLNKSTSQTFDLKQGVGGMTDIEFIAQYQVLRWSTHYPDLVETTGVLPLFRLLEKHQLMEPILVEQLSSAYRDYRAEIHRLTLQNQATLVNNHCFEKQRQWVIDGWAMVLEDSSVAITS
jgi:glutamate-ammonia-ligase adenylyltransferase